MLKTLCHRSYRLYARLQVSSGKTTGCLSPGDGILALWLPLGNNTVIPKLFLARKPARQPSTHIRKERGSEDQWAPQGMLPDRVLVHRTLDAGVPETPEALRYQLQAGRQMLRLGRVSAGQLNSVGRFLQDVQDSLEDSPGCSFSEKRMKLLQTRGKQI